MDEDRARWDERYAGRRDGPVASAAAPEALALLDEVALARAAADRARRSTSPAEPVPSRCGWRSGDGRHRARRVTDRRSNSPAPRPRAHGLDDRIDAHVHDLDDGLPAGRDRRVDHRVPTLPRPATCTRRSSRRCARRRARSSPCCPPSGSTAPLARSTHRPANSTPPSPPPGSTCSPAPKPTASPRSSSAPLNRRHA